MSAPGQRRNLVAALCVTTAASLPIFLVAGMAPEVKHSLHFDSADLGILAALYYTTAAVTSIPGGRLAEWAGGGRLMRTGAVLVALLLATIATFARSDVSLGVLLVGAGVATSAISPATNLFLARRMEPTWQGLAFGIKQSAVPLAAVCGGLAVPALAVTIGWRSAFVAGAAIAAVAALLVPRSRVALSVRRRQRRSEPARPVRWSPVVLYACGIGFAMFASSGLTTFVVVAASSSGFSNIGAGLVAAAGGGFAVLGRIVSGAQADRTRTRIPHIVVSMLVGGSAGFVLLALSAAIHLSVLFLPGVALALGLGWGCNGLINFMVVLRYHDTPAKATGATQVGARLGGVFGPIAVGFLVTEVSYSWAWMVAAAAGILAALSIAGGEWAWTSRMRVVV